MRTPWLLSLALLLVGFSRGQTAPPAPSPDDFFEKEVRPLLVEHCLECHGDKKPRGGLRLTSRASLLRGGDSGPAAIAGKPASSLLIQAVHYTDTPRMPPKRKLSERHIATLERWVALGLPWPDTVTKPVTSGAASTITPEQRRFWSLQPVRAVVPPQVKNQSWVRTPLDRFLLARLEARGLAPAPAADKRTLLRRLTFDLTGLPPTPEEVDAFLTDLRPDAWSRAVDRLLASPAYGERWGRHWLDLVRYTDSFDARGIGGEMDCADAWRYRDQVVAAFNRDQPYDRFVIDQIAGDVVSGAGPRREGTIATGLLALGNWGGGDADKEKLLTDIVDDQIDVVARTFLGLTIACARCHDHKFDPISQADYYGLAGIFFSTHILPNVGPKTNGPPMLRIPLATAAELALQKQAQERLAQVEKDLRELRTRAYADLARSEAGRARDYLLAAADHLHPSSGRGPRSLEERARDGRLLPFALRRLVEQMGGGDYRLMSRSVRDLAGFKGVHGWRGEPDCPNLVVNTNSTEAAIATFKLPPRSVAIHPGPKNGVAVAWQSPWTGAVQIDGRLADADSACGDGVQWLLDHNRAGVRRQLASGQFANGGRQRFAEGKGAESLRRVEVQAGERLELLVLPGATHICDTTVVEWTIRALDGSRQWSLAADLLKDPLAGNPHPDSQGHAGVWHFLDMAESRRAVRPAAPAPDWQAWERAVQAYHAGSASRRDLEATADVLARSPALSGARGPFWIQEATDEQFLPATVRAELARLTAQQTELRRAASRPQEFANGAQEGGVPGSPHAGLHDVRIHVRGRYDRLGDLVPRRFPEVLAGHEQAPIPRGSGRLELAQWITRSDNPLTARVIVNRLWQQHFGEGLVRTPSNFGKLGEPPMHPELLDWLAGELVRQKWSLKALHRTILLSAAYQQSSVPHPETMKADPDNRLFGRMNRRRLEAEALRDSLLAVSGELERRPGGPADRDFATPRRTLYQMTIRSERSGFGPLFDVADSTAPTEKRTTSTVAPQALFLLNNPFALARTRTLARRILQSGNDDRVRIEQAYRWLYARPPHEDELAIGLAFLAEGSSAGARDKTWEEYAQVLLCANEFLYID
jgi:hypothetical protein